MIIGDGVNWTWLDSGLLERNSLAQSDYPQGPILPKECSRIVEEVFAFRD